MIHNSSINMYHTDFRCTYLTFDDDYEADEVYRTEFGKAMGCINEYCDTTVRQTQDYAFDIINQHPIGRELMARLADTKPPQHIAVFLSFSSNPDEYRRTLFTTLFGFSTFALVHDFICNIIENREVSSDQVDKIVTVYQE